LVGEATATAGTLLPVVEVDVVSAVVPAVPVGAVPVVVVEVAVPVVAVPVVVVVPVDWTGGVDAASEAWPGVTVLEFTRVDTPEGRIAAMV